MATDAYFQCTKCPDFSYPGMFEGLRAIAEGRVTPCSKCGANRNFHLDFSFATDGSTSRRCKVINAFVPSARPKWKQGKETVEFFPFLVFLEQEEPYDRGVWLPYWHVKGPKGCTRPVYGQWAPFMDLDLYNDLVAQARAAGCLE